MALDMTTFDSTPWPGIGVNCQLIFHLLGSQKIVDIFESNFSDVLDNCIAKIPNTGPGGTDYVDSAKLMPIETGLKSLSALFKRQTAANAAGKKWAATTLEDLVTHNVEADNLVLQECATLKRLGCFFAFDHIPKGTEHHAKSLIASYNFLDVSPGGMGNNPLSHFLNTTGSNRIARKAKLAGIFKVIADPFKSTEVVRSSISEKPGGTSVGDGNGQCCSGGTCQAVASPHDPDDFYCELSDPNDPMSGCNSMADPCV